MKEYIRKNYAAIILGIALANTVHYTFQIISDTIVKVSIVRDSNKK